MKKSLHFQVAMFFMVLCANISTKADELNMIGCEQLCYYPWKKSVTCSVKINNQDQLDAFQRNQWHAQQQQLRAFSLNPTNQPPVCGQPQENNSGIFNGLISRFGYNIMGTSAGNVCGNVYPNKIGQTASVSLCNLYDRDFVAFSSEALSGVR